MKSTKLFTAGRENNFSKERRRIIFQNQLSVRSSDGWQHSALAAIFSLRSKPSYRRSAMFFKTTHRRSFCLKKHCFVNLFISKSFFQATVWTSL
ncbi:hypothetical protein A2833_01900 [Candidatus Azambacteria bacterium RIFCSPHIGHO2_01_FULL_44_55]|nr:MAG: hypothetical protein A3A18_02895 [Candidatus Azambacteria bacterium RIFCSPLOWO2_01_FULL_44_84]OGD32998.1 MAG: hypothetical protein A3C78_01290 [Candidatus Azambacteria bacterium RIFCSPHIGHO2_02_FULL_45_18]OGD39718.1 MAG: hypothetical protein A2833_01900 [Candidatus Azambacteria bacterium RIFCSPHIGHO2_01_FULL_44_55]